MNRRWAIWIRREWRYLEAGLHVQVAEHLPHPRSAGFKPLTFAEDVGQCRDYALSLNDGSRIHIHEECDGTLVVHRDRWDPAAGPVHLVAHVALETTAGKAFMLAGATYGAIRWLSRATPR